MQTAYFILALALIFTIVIYTAFDPWERNQILQDIKNMQDVKFEFLDPPK